MRKFLNIYLFDSGGYKLPNSLPTVYNEESESTVLRFIYEPSIVIFKDDTLFNKVLTIKNSVGTYSYNLQNNEYTFKKQDLIEGNIVLNLEIYKVEEQNEPVFVIKYYINNLPPIRKSLSAVEIFDWKNEYDDLFEQSMGTKLQQFKDKIAQIEEDIGAVNTIVSNKVTQLENGIYTINNDISSIYDNISSFRIDFDNAISGIEYDMLMLGMRVDEAYDFMWGIISRLKVVETKLGIEYKE